KVPNRQLLPQTLPFIGEHRVGVTSHNIDFLSPHREPRTCVLKKIVHLFNDYWKIFLHQWRNLINDSLFGQLQIALHPDTLRSLPILWISVHHKAE
ncbi:unnamed protein product, partial [Heterotrigona itama]